MYMGRPFGDASNAKPNFVGCWFLSYYTLILFGFWVLVIAAFA